MLRGQSNLLKKNHSLKITWIFASCSYRCPPQLKICQSSSQSLVFLSWAAAAAEILLDKFNSPARMGLISEAHLFCSDKENFLSLQFRSADSNSVPKATKLNTLQPSLFKQCSPLSNTEERKLAQFPGFSWLLYWCSLLKTQLYPADTHEIGCSSTRYTALEKLEKKPIALPPPAISCCHAMATQIILLSYFWVKKLLKKLN